mmetsp:Transcript_30092/g.71644  ORF Transcript_30092/g.71644 Transcript_30092/m.71644 type:complete len:254 (+) Transcript_30092:347-1108(+)
MYAKFIQQTPAPSLQPRAPGSRKGNDAWKRTGAERKSHSISAVLPWPHQPLWLARRPLQRVGCLTAAHNLLALPGLTAAEACWPTLLHFLLVQCLDSVHTSVRSWSMQTFHSAQRTQPKVLPALDGPCASASCRCCTRCWRVLQLHRRSQQTRVEKVAGLVLRRPIAPQVDSIPHTRSPGLQSRTGLLLRQCPCLPLGNKSTSLIHILVSEPDFLAPMPHPKRNRQGGWPIRHSHGFDPQSPPRCPSPTRQDC